jgi:hypothetical protein
MLICSSGVLMPAAADDVMPRRLISRLANPPFAHDAPEVVRA